MTDLHARVGTVPLVNPIMLASGTAGYGPELASFLPLDQIGAVVTKSLAAYEWAGNPAPRVHPTRAGMLNAVGLQGPGVAAWLEHDLPSLLSTGATVVVSIWGRTVDDYLQAAEMLAQAPVGVVAVEVNLSCPNLKGKEMFAQSPASAAAVMAATALVNRPRWAKLTAAVASVPEIARAAVDGGASAVTLINTVPGLVLDISRRRPLLGNGSGGLSGAAIGPVALKAVWDVRAALPDLPIIGVGGISTAQDVVAMLLAGANAVQIGTASFADPRSAFKVLKGSETMVRSQWHWVVE